MASFKLRCFEVNILVNKAIFFWSQNGFYEIKDRKNQFDFNIKSRSNYVWT
jgi:hypothetical protein